MLENFMVKVESMVVGEVALSKMEEEVEETRSEL